MSGFGVPGVNGTVAAMVPWDPDGAGPLGTHLVVGGSFTVAGTGRATQIAMYEPVSGQWSSLGTLNGTVKALTVLPNGNLVAAGGLFIGSTFANCVASWDGVSWSMLGSGCSSPPLMGARVDALAVAANGDLIAAGQFQFAGGLPAGNIARWDGAAWHAMGDLTHPFLGFVNSLAALPNGDVVAGGFFNSAGGVPCTGVARWDGAAWHALGSGLTPTIPGALSIVSHVEAMANGDVVVAGLFGFAGGLSANNIARWDGSAWSPLGPGLSSGFVSALHALPNGNLLVGGGGALTSAVVQWDGSNWSGVGNLSATSAVMALASLGNGTWYAGGDFRPQGNFTGRGIARWNGAAWQGLSTGTDGAIEKVVSLGNGRYMVLGDVRSVAGVSVSRAALFDGQSWHAAGDLVAGPVTAAAALPNGDVLVAIRITPQSTNTQCNVQRWNGSAWSSIGITSSLVTSMVVAANGDLYMGGDFSLVGAVSAPGLAVWDGVAWSGAPSGMAAGGFTALLFRRDGQLVASAGGLPGYIASWNGSVWVPMAGGLQQPATALTECANDDVVAAGYWGSVAGTPCLRIARWDGSSWHALGTGLGAPSSLGGDIVNTVVGLPNGDVVAAGKFQVAGGVAVHNVARWDGSAWHDFGSGCDGPVASMVATSSGAIALAGDFVHVDGRLSAFFARVEPVCPALSVRYGASCFGALESLRIENPAFAGGVLRSRVDGFPAGSLVLNALGFAPAQMPLSTVLPQGVAGCALLVTPAIVDVVPAVGPTAQATFAIPRAQALVGMVLYQQALPVDLNAVGGFAVYGSNGQALVIGGLW